MAGVRPTPRSSLPGARSYCEPSRFVHYLYSQLHLPREYSTRQPSEIPTTAPSVVKFTPPVLDTRPISGEDLVAWNFSPEQLIGKCFISTEMVRRIFYIDNFSIRRRKGAQYDVLYEDLGLDEV